MCCVVGLVTRHTEEVTKPEEGKSEKDSKQVVFVCTKREKRKTTAPIHIMYYSRKNEERTDEPIKSIIYEHTSAPTPARI